MTARWEDPHYDAPSWLERQLDRLADRIQAIPTDPLADAVRREAMIAHPSNQGATAGEAPRPTHGTAGRGANHVCEAPSRTGFMFAVAGRDASDRTVGPARLIEVNAWVEDDDTARESPRWTALGITVAFLAVVGLVLAAVSCDPNPATSLGCADDSCEVQG